VGGVSAWQVEPHSQTKGAYIVYDTTKSAGAAVERLDGTTLNSGHTLVVTREGSVPAQRYAPY
jgi:hypothetical protein